MTDKQRLFAEEYVRDRDPQRAYKAAYPRVKKNSVAASNAYRLLNHADFTEVQAYIRDLMDRAADEAVADAHEVLVYLTSVIRGKSQSEIVVVEGTGEGCSSARHIDKAPDEKEKLKAAEILAKYHNLLTPKVEATNQGGGVILMTPVMPDG